MLNNITYYGIFFILISSLISCSQSKLFKEKVVSRMDNVKEKPKWATLSKTMYEKDNTIFIVGFASASESARLSALTRVADNNARYELGRFIENEMTFIFQNVEEGLEDGGNLSQYFSSEISKVVSNEIKTESRYFEKIQTTKPDDEITVQTHMYSLVTIRKSSLLKAVKERISSKNKLSAKLKEQVEDRLISKINNLD